MKKKLEAELISIAHRILKLKNRSDVDQLYAETQKLYEKLSVLRFVETHFGEAKPTIGTAGLEAELENIFEAAGPEPETAPEKRSESKATPAEDDDKGPEAADAVAETEEEATKESGEEAEEPASTENDDEPEMENEETENKNEELKEEPTGEDDADFAHKEITETEGQIPIFSNQISFDDLMAHHYDEPVFVKAGEKLENEQAAKELPAETDNEVNEQRPEAGGLQPEESQLQENPEPAAAALEEKPAFVNDHLSKTITIGLNDRIGFEKHLFGGSSEDLNRVLSQLNTFDSFDEAKAFIADMVKPDYNEWNGKEDYEQRFLDIIEKRFS